MADWFAEAAKYFGKRWAGKSPLAEKQEEAIGMREIAPQKAVPPAKPESEKKLKEKSTGGSPPFTDAELRQGYRKL